MSISIIDSKCVGCKACVEICPGNIIAINDEKKAYLPNPDTCWGCTACLKECKFDAMEYYLGLDIGGKGGTLSVKVEKDKKIWTLKNGERTEVIETLVNESNRY